MLKKIFISLSMIVALSFLFSAKVSAQSYLLGMIDINFCNHDQANKELDVIAKAGEDYPLCVEFTNKSTSDITINVEFLDSIITDDSIKNRACNAADRPKRHFGNFLLPYEKDITLPAQETTQKIYMTKYPIGFSWLSHGCLAYYIVGGDIADSDMLTVRIRSIKYIDIFVANKTPIQVIKLSQAPILTRIDNEYIISFWLVNQWNIDEKIHVVNTLSNIFGYQKEFNFDAIIPANTWIILTTPSFIMPIYGWPYRFKGKISYTPQFDFNITQWVHPSQLYAWGTKKMQALLFIRSRQSRITIGMLGFFIYVSWRIKKKPQAKQAWDLKL